MLTSSGYITVYTSILTIYALYFLINQKININFSILDYLIILFFTLSAISTLINIKVLGNFMFFKSILDLRFAILFFTIRNLIDQKIVNIKIFCIVSLICTIFVSSDIFLQVIYGKDLLGYPEIDGRYGAIFGKEAIAGSYIQKFSLLSILSVFLLTIKDRNKFYLTIFVMNFLSLGILMSLDRMPYIIYIFSIIILLILVKQYRLRFILSSIIICSIFIFFFNNNSKVENKYLSLSKEIEYYKILEFLTSKVEKVEKVENISENKINNDLSSDYLKIYNTAYKIFLNNIFIGSGVKSYHSECLKLQIKDEKNISCSTHPHNIYLEILVNEGIIGLLIFVSFILILLKRNYLDQLLTKTSVEKKLFTIFFLAILISELMPFRSYGSIFQTVNGTIFWFLLALASSKFSTKKF
jgi:hypothetical protein